MWQFVVQRLFTTGRVYFVFGDVDRHDQHECTFCPGKIGTKMRRNAENQVRSQKKNDIIWEFFPNVGPPPLLGTPYPKKNFSVYFAFQNLRSIFVLQKKIIFQEHFQNNVGNLLKVLGIGDPPPFWEKFPNNPVFFIATG